MAWPKPRILKSYPEFGKVILLRCFGTKRQPHRQVGVYWSYKLGRVVEVSDPYRAQKKLNWWEEKRGRDKCPECGDVLRGSGTVRKGPMRGMRKKVCVSKKPHRHGKNFYFDPATGRPTKARVGRADIPVQARVCPGCREKLISGGPCVDHPKCHLMICKNSKHRKRQGARQYHWSVVKEQFVPHTRRKSLPRRASKVQTVICPRCKKPMSWRMRRDYVQFTCPGCVRRYGKTHIIHVNFNNEVIRRSKGRA